MSEALIRKQAKKRILIESILVFFIVVSPFIYTVHEYFPTKSVAKIDFLGMEIGSHGFTDVSTYIWFLIGKFVPLYLLIIWFFTCKHWWYHAILIPITMYVFQLLEVINSGINIIDTDNLLWILPVFMVVLPIVYFIRVKLYDKHVHGIDLEAMDAELKELRAKHGDQDSKAPDHKYKEATDETLPPLSISEELNQKFSTANIEHNLKQLQHKVENWLHVKF